MKKKKNIRGNFIKWPLINNSERDTLCLAGMEWLVYDKILFFIFLWSSTLLLNLVLGVNDQICVFYGRRIRCVVIIKVELILKR